MSKQVIWFYLLIVFVILGIMLVGIYVENDPRESGEESAKSGFKPLSVRVKEATAEMRAKEETLRTMTADSQFDREVHIPAGETVIGDRDGQVTEQPERKIFLGGYYIDQFEVTFAQYYRFVKTTGHRKPRLAGYLAVGSENLPFFMDPYHPVVGVSWLDGYEYCKWKGKRLPSEAEWERAARGLDGRKWPWGDSMQPGASNLLGEEDDFKYTAPAGSFPLDRSPEGVFDMAGNAMEWVQDWYREDYYRNMPAENPAGPATGELKGIRGASWNDSVKRARTTIRFKAPPEYRDVTIGFRCARSESDSIQSNPPETRK